MKKTYLITGATSDLGLCLINKILSTDLDAMILAQGSSSVDRLEPLLKDYPQRIKIYRADLSSAEETQSFIDTILADYSPTHLVHLPALRVVNKKFKSFDLERFKKDFDLQLQSAILLCKAFAPIMAKNKYGRILFMQSSYTLGAPPKNTAAYVIVKSAMEGLMKSLAVEYAGSHITVNSVAPSMIETRFLSDTSNLIIEASAADNPMGRNATVDDVVPAMYFLLSDDASFITGVTLPITGGSVLV